jgi:hypothetical protein
MRLIAFIAAVPAVRAILAHLGEPIAPPSVAPVPGGPPLQEIGNTAPALTPVRRRATPGQTGACPGVRSVHRLAAEARRRSRGRSSGAARATGHRHGLVDARGRARVVIAAANAAPPETKPAPHLQRHAWLRPETLARVTSYFLSRESSSSRRRNAASGRVTSSPRSRGRRCRRPHPARRSALPRRRQRAAAAPKPPSSADSSDSAVAESVGTSVAAAGAR